MRSGFKGNLVMFIAFIYLVFACSYVVLCSRNFTVVNIFKSNHSISSGNSHTADKTIGKFLSRPRVITRRINNSLIIAVILITFLAAYRKLSSEDYKLYSSQHYFADFNIGVIFLRRLRF